MESSVRNLKDLNVETSSNGTLLISMIFDHIPEELKIIISRSFKAESWVLDDFLQIFKEELLARERCSAIGTEFEFEFELQ